MLKVKVTYTATTRTTATALTTNTQGPETETIKIYLIYGKYLVDKESVTRVGVDDVNPLVGELVEREALRQALLQKGGNLRYTSIECIPHMEVERARRIWRVSAI